MKEIARLESRVFDLRGRQHIERKPADEQAGGDRFGQAKLPFAEGRRAVLPHRDLAVKARGKRKGPRRRAAR